MQSSHTNPIDLKAILQPFLNNLTDEKKSISISLQTFENQKPFIEFRPLKGEHPLVDKPDARSCSIAIGRIVMNNILALHILLVDQSLEIKKAMIKQHQRLVVNALLAIFIDHQQLRACKSYQTINVHDLEALRAQVKPIIKEFVNHSIKLDFDSEALKNFLIKYSTLGLKSLNFKYEAFFAEIIKHKNLSEHSADNNKFFTASYGGRQELNLIFQLKQLCHENLETLNLSDRDERAASERLEKTWRFLENQQLKDFREKSRWTRKKLATVWALCFLVGMSALFIMAPIIISIPVILIASSIASLDLYKMYQFEREILPQHQNSHHIENREDLRSFIVSRYQPRKLAYTPKASPSHSQPSSTIDKSFEIPYFVPSFNEASTSKKRHRPKKLSTSSATTQPTNTTSSTTVANVAGRRKGEECGDSPSTSTAKILPQIISANDSAYQWKRPENKKPFAPDQDYVRITGSLYGYLPKKTIDELHKIMPQKVQKAQENNGVRLLKLASAKRDEGVVLLDKQQQKHLRNTKYHPSKIKFLGSEARIPGILKATTEDGKQLVCYDKVEKPKHQKKSK